MECFLASELKLGLRLSRQWQEHPTLDILGIRVGHAEAKAVDGGGENWRGRGRESDKER